MQLFRPYDNRWMIQGTLGLYSESRNAVYLQGHSPQYEQWEPFDPVSGETRARVVEGAERQRGPVQPRGHGLPRTDEVPAMPCVT